MKTLILLVFILGLEKNFAHGFYLYNVDARMCAGFVSITPSSGDSVVAWGCQLNRATQDWFWNGKSLVNRESNKCLSVSSSVGGFDLGVEQFDCNDSNEQHWFWTGLGPIRAFSADSDWCLYGLVGRGNRLTIDSCSVLDGREWAQVTFTSD